MGQSTPSLPCGIVVKTPALVGMLMASLRFYDALAAASAAHREFESFDLHTGEALGAMESDEPSATVEAVDLFVQRLGVANLALRRELNRREDLVAAAGILAEEINVEAKLAGQEAVKR